MPIKRSARGAITTTLTKRGRERKPRATDIKQGRKKLAAGVIKEVRERLKFFVDKMYGTPYEIGVAFGIPPSTKAAWFSKSAATVPDVASVWPLVERRLSLDWLFTGEGHYLRLEDVSSPAASFGSAVEAHLMAEGAIGADEARAGVKNLIEANALSGDDELFRFAIDAALAEFRKFRELLTVYATLVRIPESRYREDVRTTHAFQPILSHVESSVGPTNELADAVRRASAESYLQRVAGWKAAIDYVLARDPGLEASPAQKAFVAWLRRRRRRLDRPNPLPQDPLADNEIVSWSRAQRR